MSPDPRFWCIAVYFNAGGYSRCLQNFLLFAYALRSTGANLLTVELSFDGAYVLPEGPDMLRLRSDSVLWHKERLITLALSHLPRHCEWVAWIDADIIFEAPDWHVRAVEKLQTADAVQLFARVLRLGPGRLTGNGSLSLASLGDNIEHEREGLIARRARLVTDWARPYGPGERREYFGGTPGYAWAARRSFLEDLGLYDRAVVGGGDKLFAHALLGTFERERPPVPMSTAMRDDVARWADGFRSREYRFDYLPIDAFHLWHGRLEDRQYDVRHHILQEADYDPTSDVCVRDGLLEWTSEKPRLHQAVRTYFKNRREDL